jgi:diguanylate cyclase (GGDEF)-like protein
VYDIENLVLAGAVTMRLFGNLSSAKRRVYIALSVYLWSYALVAFALNYFELERNIAQGLQDVFWGLPCLLLLAVLAFWPERSGAITDTNKDSNRSMALMLDNLSPVVFTLVIVIMGARIAPAYPWIGFSSIAIAVMLYGLRAALLQSKYLRSQQDLTRSGAALVDAIDQPRDISIRDGLTGIYNRRHFDEVLLAEWKRSIRTAKPLSLLLIDVDNFKKLNDRYGHPEGDECLKKIAEQLSKILRRSSDTLARYGGEEFVAILPETTKESAQLIADAMRLSVEELKIKNEGSKVARVVTVSIGVCSENTTLNRPAEELLNAADAALYRAKKLGRNCVQIA